MALFNWEGATSKSPTLQNGNVAVAAPSQVHSPIAATQVRRGCSS